MKLIDADVLMTELSKLIDGENDGTEGMKMWDNGVKSAIKILKSAPTVETTDDVLDMNVKQFVPTEEELLSLGFKKTQDFTRQNGGKKLEDWEIRGRYS